MKTADGTIVVTVNEPDAEVFVDGERITVTRKGDEPIEIRKSPGTHTVEVKKGGFKVEGQKVTLTAGGRVTVNLAFQDQFRKPVGGKWPELASGLKAGQPLVPDLDLGGGVTMKFVFIPSGEFLMGAPDGEKDAEDGEKPQHWVRITKGFYMGIFEVTQEQYEAVMAANPSSHKVHNTNLDTRQFPVENVSWENADRFCDKLTLKTGKRIALPTDAEWEYACRAGTTTPFHWGTSLNGTQANCLGEHPYATTAKGPSLRRPCKVGSYEPNPWGLYDMHGNVFEWCRDCYDPDFYKKHTLFVDPFNQADGWRVVRSGGYGSGGVGCRAALRHGVTPWEHYGHVGFRVLCRAD
ncbi:MAG: SUMF1/EgtB/PvdO family nonheme iron enzyme [Gemmataceae bacterium]